MDESFDPDVFIRRIGERLVDNFSDAKAGTTPPTVYKDGPEEWKESWSAKTATRVGGSEQSDAFRMLVRWIRKGVESGRTSHVRSFDRYFKEKSPGQSTKLFCIPKLGMPPDGEA